MEVDELLEAVDIADIASMFTDLEEKNGELWGISPLTYPPEKTPSFSVRRETGRFYDFSSGVGGTAITLVQYCCKLSKHEAIEWLKRYIGCDNNDKAPRKKLAATLVCKKFSRQKKPNKQASSNHLPKNCMEKYEKRRDKLSVWGAEGISPELLDKFGVCYDSFSDRLVYPIRNLDGQIVNIGGRTLDPSWKEKGLRKYTYFKSWNGGMNLVYGLYENMEAVKTAHEIIIFEGCKSVLIADTWGIHNCGALLTSHLSAEQMKILAKLGCRVVFALDKEVDITKDHNISKLRQYVNVEYVCSKNGELKEKDSPVDRGKAVFDELYRNRCRFR